MSSRLLCALPVILLFSACSDSDSITDCASYCDYKSDCAGSDQLARNQCVGECAAEGYGAYREEFG